MISYKPFTIQLINIPTLTLVIVWLISACSGSSESMEGDNQPSDNSLATDSSTVVPDPLAQSVIRVTFNIMVPAYQSNALQVRIEWGDKDLSANWIGDESWIMSDDFPINTEHPLIVSFNDYNGEITLGAVVRNFTTGSNSAEEVAIDANQFDTQLWDDDSDGVSNFEELNLGTDPLEANGPTDADNINLQDTLTLLYSNWSAPAAGYYEPEINLLELPADIHETNFIDNLPFSSENTITDIALSADGNGTYQKTYEFFIALDMPYNQSSSATRTYQGDTVRWSGTETYSGSSRYYGAFEHIFETASTVVGRTLLQQGNGYVTLRRGAWANSANVVRYNYNFILNLDSIDEENKCSISHGTSYHSFERNIESEGFSEFTASRNSSEENWIWSDTVDGAVSSGQALNVNGRLYCDFIN